METIQINNVGSLLKDGGVLTGELIVNDEQKLNVTINVTKPTYKDLHCDGFEISNLKEFADYYFRDGAYSKTVMRSIIRPIYQWDSSTITKAISAFIKSEVMVLNKFGLYERAE